MNSKVYRWCSVPQCNNTSIKTPNKLFINVPMKKKVRSTWLNLARRDPAAISLKSVIYFCQDHFDLPNDMENYIQYHVMGSVSQVRMKSGCIPTRFECQLDRRKRTSNTTERTYALKKQRKTKKKLIENSAKALAEESTSEKYLDTSVSSDPDAEKESVLLADIVCKNCQNVIVGFRYRCISCEDYDLCQKCEMMETHSEHYVLRIPKPLKYKEAAEIAQKLQEIFKLDKHIPTMEEEGPIGDSIGECRDDEPIQDDNVDGDVQFSEEVNNIIHSEVSRVIDECKDIGEHRVTVRRKKKRTAGRETGGDVERMCDTAAEVNTAPEIAFVDANFDFDMQKNSIQVEIKQEMCTESEIISRLSVGETVNPYLTENQL